MRPPGYPLIQERIAELTLQGCDARKLLAKLAVDFPELPKEKIRESLVNIILAGELVEIEYLLPGRVLNDSLLLPRGTKIMGMSFRNDWK